MTAFNDRLYVHTGSNIVQSTDGGESWKSVRIDTNEQTSESIGQERSHINFSYNSKIVGTDGGLYGIVPEKYNLRVFRLSVEGDVLAPIQADSATVYGAGDTGLYRLDPRGPWEQISPSMPDKVISLVIHKDKLYIATQQHGIFHSPLPTEYRNELSQR